MDTKCSHCQARLAVDDGLSNQEVRCPECEFVFVVAPILESESSSAEATAASRSGTRHEKDEGRSEGEVAEEKSADGHKREEQREYFLRIPEGRNFGPISKETLDDWVREGRISHDCHLKTDDEIEWHSADELYPILSNDGSPFSSVSLQPRQPVEPHRGHIIFGLAILGCIVPFLSIVPAIWGIRDLKMMNLGRMDSQGDAMTRSGQAIAMVSSMVWCGSCVVGLLALLISTMSNL